MKRIIYITAALILAVMLCACGMTDQPGYVGPTPTISVVPNVSSSPDLNTPVVSSVPGGMNDDANTASPFPTPGTGTGTGTATSAPTGTPAVSSSK